MLSVFLGHFLLSSTLIYTGEARDRRGDVVYREKHEEVWKAKSLASCKTDYFSPDGEKIAELTSTYKNGPSLPSYRFRDLRTGYEDGVDVSQSQLEVFFRSDSKALEKRKEFDFDPRYVAGQGFNTRIRATLEEFVSGKVDHIHLLAPSKLDYFQFRVRKRSETENEITLRLEIDNWFLRLFLSYVEATYDKRTKRLLKYEGISNIEGNDGRNPNVTIVYRYL